MSGEKFEECPIIFGDYLRVGAAPSDRVYEELIDMKKVFHVLGEVSDTQTHTHTHTHVILFVCSIWMIST